MWAYGGEREFESSMEERERRQERERGEERAI